MQSAPSLVILTTAVLALGCSASDGNGSTATGTKRDAGSGGIANDGGTTAAAGGGSGGGGIGGSGAGDIGGGGIGGLGGAGIGGSGGAGIGGLGGGGIGGCGLGGSGGSSTSTALSMGYVFEMQVGGIGDLDKLDYTAVDFVVHAFVAADVTTAALSGVGQFDAYRQAGLAAKVHATGAKIVLSVGGANHSWSLKQIAKNPSLTSTLAANIVAKINQWGYDGVDIDLEFPWGGNEPQEHLALMTAVYSAVKANDPNHIVMFGVSPGYLISEYVWSQLKTVSDYGFYFCYSWSNPANGPMTNPGIDFTIFDGNVIEASCRGALDYIVDHGYPANQIIVGLPYFANGGAPWYTAPAGIDSIAPHTDYMEVDYAGYWTTPTAMEMKIDAVLDPQLSVLTGSAVVAGVGWWQWGQEDPNNPVLTQAIKQKLGK